MQSRRNPPLSETPKIGVRQRARLDSIRRIVSAARTLFVELGYDATTLQRIANDSNLAMGTLFHYISDKRDLLYLIFNEEFDKVTTAGLKAHRPSQNFSRQSTQYYSAVLPPGSSQPGAVQDPAE